MSVIPLRRPAGTEAAPPAEPRRRHPWVIALLVTALVVAVGTAVDLRRRLTLPGPQVVLVEPITRGPIAGMVRAGGVVQPARTTVLYLPAAGRMVEAAVAPGQRVQRGQALARFDALEARADLARAEARLVAAEAAAFEAELAMARLAREPRDDEDVADARDVAAVRGARAAAELAAREADFRVARTRVKQTVLRAPGDALVLAREAEPGQVVAAGAPVFRLVPDGAGLEVVAEAPETALGTLGPGQPARFSVPAHPGRTHRGRVARVGLLHGPEGARRVPVVISVEPAAEGLAPGMTATVAVETAAGGPVFRVPLAALEFSPARGPRGDEPAVWLIAGDGVRLTRVSVEVGAVDGRVAEVRGAGLREGAGVAVGFAALRK